MQSEVTDKSVVAAAQALFAGTVAMWEWDERCAGADAATAEAQARKAAPSSEVDDGGLSVALADERAQVEAFRSRGPRVWDVCSTPDDDDRVWALVPRGWDGRVTELEAARARKGGDLVVEPGDDAHRIAEKLKAIRALRRTMTSA